MDWLIFVSVNIIIMVFMFLFLSRRLHRQYNSKQFMAEMQQEVNAIITEMNQTTERNLQLIEDRMEQVAALTAQLDKRIIMAKSAEEKRPDSGGTYNQITQQRRQIQREMSREPIRDIDLFNAVEGEPVAELAAPTPTPPPLAEQKPAAEPPLTVSPNAQVVKLQKIQGREAMKAQVTDMAQAGIAPSLIAQHFGISLGEVELIISLRTGQ